MTDFAKEILPVSIENELKQSYLSYALSVIHGRALPDIRDGLKPVHRRILYAMYDLKNSYNKPYKKSARVVGDVIGKYHPHGDSAVYDAMVRMAQNFSMRYTLVEGQGNFGSIDGDPPAAMRYTEVRMAKITDQMLADLEKETVSFSENYDGSEHIPDVLPTKIPNLLINGSSGIAVGMATNIPPHNLTEVINASILVSSIFGWYGLLSANTILAPLNTKALAVETNVKEGTIFISPSYTLHFVHPNQVRKHRTIISFDLLPKLPDHQAVD